MRAVFCDTLDGPAALRVREVADPVPADGQVLVAMHAAGVNFPDLLMTEGKYQYKPPVPFVPGMEGAGVVARSHSAAFCPGDRVMVSARAGTWAEFCAVPATQLAPLPHALSFEEGATFRVAFMTAHHALCRQAGLGHGEWVLVNGATGGVGMAAVQLARHLGARVIATGGRPEKLSAVHAAGADHLIDLTTTDLRDAVMAITGGAGVDVVYDPVGGAVFEQSLRAAAYGARILIVGFASGTIPSVPINRYLIKALAVYGIRAGESGRRDPAAGATDEAALMALAASGDLKPHISVRLPLARAADALEAMRDRKVAGRAVLLCVQ